ncbi:uncharacterized protein PV09_09420 [Verruconis gallopava]|uniref:Aldehyde dehydrogenase domain-containing protein n=1 Tax=Verruconis gallopava TaxID=253628 RepID=A0A0D1ZXP6_9PEZI|nr:uncharacterized protein PV09_09420 [Verruconis gallopava]KIV98849.1 hypothetical protein PV09_09420 [Verruconis gallopava]
MTHTPPFKLRRPSLLKSQAFVDGKWIGAKSGKLFNILDPGTGENWASVPDNGAADVDAAVQAAQNAFVTYSKTSPRERFHYLLRWSRLIEENKEDLATIVTYETGKPISESLAEIDYAVASSYWFAAEADRVQGACFNSSVRGKKVITVKQPIGVVAALVPWNFPVSMTARKAGAALAAGCTMVLKPSPEAPMAILALMVLANEAGLPNGVINVLTTSLINTPALSEALCRHSGIKKVTFTGSTRVGKLISKMCSSSLKKVTLELGGNCPFLVFDDANLDQAADALMALKWRNAGQACVTANRVFVKAGIYDKFVSIIIERTTKLVVGHGGDPSSSIGPVTTTQSLDRADDQVKDARRHGARILLGGERIKSCKGFFFQPTIIGEANRNMRVSDEESFAPILTFYKFATEEEAVLFANDTSMGLASYVFTKDLDRAWRLSDELEAGMIGVNTSGISGVETPFGGLKESGYGKEAGKDVAVDEYLVTKAISIAVESRL